MQMNTHISDGDVLNISISHPFHFLVIYVLKRFPADMPLNAPISAPFHLKLPFKCTFTFTHHDIVLSFRCGSQFYITRLKRISNYPNGFLRTADMSWIALVCLLVDISSGHGVYELTLLCAFSYRLRSLTRPFRRLSDKRLFQ